MASRVWVKETVSHLSCVHIRLHDAPSSIKSCDFEPYRRQMHLDLPSEDSAMAAVRFFVLTVLLVSLTLYDVGEPFNVVPNRRPMKAHRKACSQGYQMDFLGRCRKIYFKVCRSDIFQSSSFLLNGTTALEELFPPSNEGFFI